MTEIRAAIDETPRTLKKWSYLRESRPCHACELLICFDRVKGTLVVTIWRPLIDLVIRERSSLKSW